MKNKKVYVILIVLILIGSLFLTYNIYQNKNKVIKTKKRKQNNLAIMIKEDGATDYTKSNSKDIPKGDYVLNRDKSYCKNNGKIGDYDSVLGKVSFSFIGSDSCYLYFDYKEDTSLYGTIKKRAKTDTTYLALYTGEGADTYANPVYYYKGNVQNNNVLFAGFCWKIVRTTETGGVKIVYNGVQKNGSCNNTGTDSQIGTSTFNSSTNSPAYVGYMHNTVYPYSIKTVINSRSFSGTKAYGDGATYASNKYTLTNATTLDVSSSNISTLVGKYTCNSSSTTGTCSNLWYIVGYSVNSVYYYSLSGGDLDGTNKGQNYVFGSSFTYANGNYTLSDTVTLNSDTFVENKSNVNTHHYTCLSSGTTCSSLYYVYYIYYGTPYYITLTGGKSVDDALNEMLYNDDVNTKDSTIKTYIDNWYKNNMTSYTEKLEDTVFCNDRSMSNKTVSGWYPNGGSTTTYLRFKYYNVPSTPSLKCTNENDKFTVESSNGNGALTYPVGLLTAPEAKLANYGSSNYLNNGQYFWLGDSNSIDYDIALVGLLGASGFTSSNVSHSRGVRPSVSLKPNTYFSSGDGSFTNPFVIGDVVEESSGKSFDTVFAANNTDIFSENGIRYEGADPNNYICLDNKTSGTCSDNSLLFRIIGLFDEDTSSDGTNSSGTKKLLKVIDTNNYGGTEGTAWSQTQADFKAYNDWSEATLKTELNGTYLTTLLGTSNVNNKLSSGIANAKWHLGGASSSNVTTLTADGIYAEERNPNAIYIDENYIINPSSIYAKVGLMYPSDYGYATVGGSTINRTGCRAKALHDYDTADCYNNDWIFKSQSSFVDDGDVDDGEWLISPATNGTGVAVLDSTGLVFLRGGSQTPVFSKLAVRPTFYLDSSVLKIVGTGDGTKDNAYRVG